MLSESKSRLTLRTSTETESGTPSGTPSVSTLRTKARNSMRIRKTLSLLICGMLLFSVFASIPIMSATAGDSPAVRPMKAASRITLSVEEKHTFPQQNVGYKLNSITPLQVTVTSDYPMDSSDLSIALTGPNPKCFRIKHDIPAETTDYKFEFSVEQKMYLSVGTYQATVTVENAADGTSDFFDIEFTVLPEPKYEIQLSRKTVDFGAPTQDVLKYYEAETVKITNTGDKPVILKDIKISPVGETRADAFTIEKDSWIEGVDLRPSTNSEQFFRAITVLPKTDLDIGKYSVDVSCSYTSTEDTTKIIGTEKFHVTIDVIEPPVVDPIKSEINGGSSSFTVDGFSNDLEITFGKGLTEEELDLSSFDGLSVTDSNGKDFSPQESEYDVRQGSIIVTLHKDYLNHLPAGKYALTIKIIDGLHDGETPSATFVLAASATAAPTLAPAVDATSTTTASVTPTATPEATPTPKATKKADKDKKAGNTNDDNKSNKFNKSDKANKNVKGNKNDSPDTGDHRDITPLILLLALMSFAVMGSVTTTVIRKRALFDGRIDR